MKNTSEKEGKNYKNIEIPRIASDRLFDIFKLNLKKGNIVIIDGLKYRYDGKNRFIIDKNTKKSADAQGKEYSDVIEIPNNFVHSEKYKNIESMKDKKTDSVVDSDKNSVGLNESSINSNDNYVVKTAQKSLLLELATKIPRIMRIPGINYLIKKEKMRRENERQERIREEKMRREKERWEKIRNGEVKEKELTDKENLVKNAVKWWSDRIDSLSNVATTENPMADAIRVIARSNKEESSEVQIKKFKIELAYELSEELERNYKESNGKKYRCYIETDWYPCGILREVVDKIGISKSAFPEKYTMEIDLLKKTVTYRNRLNLPNTYTLIKL